MPVTNDSDLWAWLNGQPPEVGFAIIYRAVMRVLPLVALAQDDREIWQDLALSAFRASLTTAVTVMKMPSGLMVVSDFTVASRAVSFAAEEISDVPAREAARAAETAGIAADFVFHKRIAYAISSDKAGGDDVYGAARVADAFARASVFGGDVYGHERGGAADDAYAAAFALVRAAEENPELGLADLMTLAIDVPPALASAMDTMAARYSDLLRSGGPWTFWAKWYDRAMAGDPLPWDLQERIALIPNEIWEAGPEAVAAEIARIEADFIASDAQLLETLVLDPDVPVYSAAAVAASNPERIARHLSRVEDALDDLIALGGNNGLTEATAEYRIIKRLLRKYSDDPERIAFDLTDVNRSISRQFTSGEYPESEPFLMLQAASTACISTICDMEPDIAAELERVYPRASHAPDEEDVAVLSEAMQLSLEVLDEPAAETTKEDFAELFRERIIDAAEEDPFDGPVRVAREYRTVVLRRQISRLAQIARDYGTVDKLAELYDGKYSKAAGVVGRVGGVGAVLWAAIKVLGDMLGIV